MTKIDRFGVLEVTKAIREEMPHLTVAVWDLEPFMGGFHNWRKNIVFVECEGLVTDELAQKLSQRFTFAAFYTGTKKIQPREFNLGPTKASVVILSRKDFNNLMEDKEISVLTPTLEEQAIDILAYSLREAIPIPVSEAANVISYVISTRAASITKMHRYATRKYVDWLFKIILYQLAKRGEIIGLEPRFAKAGEQYLRATKGVENRE
ncbi:MAG TPA: DUF6577 family protein [Candidatus Bilamarchaeaceae archaeon]|nr:DUF6577 family protein [Candidatus Bilamarchaeaceae archaeon]